MLNRITPHALVSVVFCVFALFFALNPGNVAGDADTLWHIAAGDAIRATGAIAPRDSWSFSAGQYPWYNIAWGYDAAASFIAQHGGVEALAALSVIAAAALLAGVAGLSLAAGAGVIGTALAALLCGLLLAPGVLMRPQLVTYAMMLVFYALLRKGVQKRDPAFFYALPFCMAVWVNCHGGFLAALTIFAAFGVECWRAGQGRLLRHMGIVLLLCAVATLASPLRAGIYGAAFRTLQSPMQAVISEWQPAVLPGHALMTAFLLAMLFTGGMRNAAIPLADRLLALLWFVLGLSSLRHIPVLGLMAFPFLAHAFSLWLGARGIFQEKEKEFAEDMAVLRVWRICAAAAVVVAMTLAFPTGRDVIAGQNMQFPEALLPREEVAFIREHYPHIRFLNDYNLGGGIIYLTRGALPVFVDGRADSAYPRGVLDDYLRFQRFEPGWEEMLGRYGGIGGVFLRKTHPANTYLAEDPHFKKVFEGGAGIVYVRLRG